MAELAKNPIKKYSTGLSCMLGEAVGKIVGESEEGSWGKINGENFFSIPLFCTPHGTVIKTGVFYLSEITKEGLKRLEQYEKEALEKGEKLYNGLLDNGKN